MDINILLALQNFRNGVGACLVSFMTKMSFIGEMNTVLIITALIYWCVSKNFGQYLRRARTIRTAHSSSRAPWEATAPPIRFATTTNPPSPRWAGAPTEWSTVF